METGKLGDLIFVYEKFATAENKSIRTIETVIHAINKFDKFLGVCIDVRTVTAEDLRRYIRHLQQQPKWIGHPTINQDHEILSDNAIASYVRSIRSFWSWLKRENFLTDNPFEQVKPPATTEKIVDPLTPEDITSLLKVIPKREFKGYRDICVILTMYGTGTRISETLALHMGDINFNSGQIKLVGKRKKERSVFMSASVFKALYKYHSQQRLDVPSNYFFVHKDGRPLTRSYFEHKMTLYVAKSGITKICTPHILRYSFAIQFLRGCGDIFVLQKILGHSTLEMTRRYLKITNTDVEVKMREYSPAEQLGVRL